jgi:hypothetical protein
VEDVQGKDEEHLRILAIFHYVICGLIGLFSCFPIIHLVMGYLIIVSPETMASDDSAPPAFMGWLFVIMGGLFIIFGWIFAICVFLAGRFLTRRKHRIYCLVVAGIACLFMPFGTVLGVFTIVVLSRESVKQLFP